MHATESRQYPCCKHCHHPRFPSVGHYLACVTCHDEADLSNECDGDACYGSCDRCQSRRKERERTDPYDDPAPAQVTMTTWEGDIYDLPWTPEHPADPYVEEADANPERYTSRASDGGQCMIYRRGN